MDHTAALLLIYDCSITMIVAMYLQSKAGVPVVTTTGIDGPDKERVYRVIRALGGEVTSVWQR